MLSVQINSEGIIMQVKKYMVLTILFVLAMTGISFGSEGTATVELASIIDVQKYFRAIHIMAMLLVGFGFLMVFVKKYGRTAVTATYLLVSVSLPLYFIKANSGFFGEAASSIDSLILAEFAAASLLICAGAVLGRVKLYQYMLLGILFVPVYAFNEWILLEGGFGLIAHGSFVDTGGSIVIHAFGAIFGLGVAYSMTTAKEYETPIETDNTSDRFSLLGSMILWVFWPSFCAALVAPQDIPSTIVNVILALCGSTLATYAVSLKVRGKVSVADIANAALAGGVAIGSTCDKVPPEYAFLIGLAAGAISTIGFALILDRSQAWVKKIDTCGVLHLHGLPGLFGGLVAIVVVDGINGGAQVLGVVITGVIAVVGGMLVGKILSITGRRTEPYIDSEELDV
jgi:ammonium transporter Rh